MELSIETGDLERVLKEKTPKQVNALIKRSMKAVAWEWENEARRIVTDGAFDTGDFAANIHHEMFEEGGEIGFIGMDGVKYGFYWEEGTVRHFVPFYAWTKENGYDVDDPILADWGHRVLGLSEEEMLKMGGMKVKIPKLKPFMRAMIVAQNNAADIFKKKFKEMK